MKFVRTLLASAALACSLGNEAAAACKMTKVATLHVSIEDNKILVPGAINGTPVQFILATDIESMILAVPAHDLGLRRMTGARYQPFVYAEEVGNDTNVAGPVNVSDLTLDGQVIKDMVMHVIGRRMDFGKPDQIAVIGRDFLHKFDVEFNLPANEVTLFHVEGCEGTNLAYWTERYNVLDMERPLRGVRVKATIDGEPVVADINSANPYTALNIDMAHKLGIATGAAALPPSHDFLADYPIDTWQATVGSIGLDQEIVRLAALRIRKLTVPPPLINYSSYLWEPETGYARPEYEFVPGNRHLSRSADLSLGVDFIRAHRMLISYSQYRVYFSHVPGQAFLE